MNLSVEHKVRQNSITHRGKRILADRAPKLIENDKRTLVMKGGHTSETVSTFLKELVSLKKPNVMALKHHNPVLPFENVSFIEKMGNKYDCSLFVLGSHSKKRPHNIVLGRLFNHEVLDMFELGITNFQSMTAYTSRVIFGSKPMLVFSGEAFEQEEEFKYLMSLFIDLFRGPKVTQLSTTGLEYQIHFVAISDKEIAMRLRRICIDRSEVTGGPPVVRVEEMGPSMNLSLRRHSLPSEDKWKRSLRIPQQIAEAVRTKKRKNVTMDAFGNQLGRVHVGRQQLDQVHHAQSKMAFTGKRKSDKAKADSSYEPPKKKFKKMKGNQSSSSVM